MHASRGKSGPTFSGEKGLLPRTGRGRGRGWGWWVAVEFTTQFSHDVAACPRNGRWEVSWVTEGSDGREACLPRS